MMYIPTNSQSLTHLEIKKNSNYFVTFRVWMTENVTNRQWIKDIEMIAPKNKLTNVWMDSGDFSWMIVNKVPVLVCMFFISTSTDVSASAHLVLAPCIRRIAMYYLCVMYDSDTMCSLGSLCRSAFEWWFMCSRLFCRKRRRLALDDRIYRKKS